MAFTTLKAARAFYCCPGKTIYLCNAAISAEQPRYIPAAGQIAWAAFVQRNKWWIIGWWQNGTTPPGKFQPPPANTVFCDSITPIRVVEDWEPE